MGNQENREKVTAAFDQLATLSRQYRFSVTIIVWPFLTDYERYGFRSVHEWVKMETEKRAFTTLDLLPVFSRFAYRELQVWADDNIHASTLGHRLAVEAFLRLYRSQ